MRVGKLGSIGKLSGSTKLKPSTSPPVEGKGYLKTSSGETFATKGGNKFKVKQSWKIIKAHKRAKRLTME